MYQLIHNAALTAVLVCVAAALWQDWGLPATVKKMVITYLGFFIVGAIMALIVRVVPMLESKSPGPDQETK